MQNQDSLTETLVPAPRPRDQLATRIIAVSLAALLIGLAMIFGTLWLSWQLEGAAAAINDTGSLRMRTTRIGLYLQADRRMADEEIAGVDRTLRELQRGDPVRPLFLPDASDVHEQMRAVTALWTDKLKPAAQRGVAHGAGDYLALLPDFIDRTNGLVSLIETDNARKITLLRLSQGVLIVIACVGTMTMIYLLYLWIIVPVLQLQRGLQRMTARDFGVRLPVESQDELGVVATGFNRMAQELQTVYADLENRVRSKTAQLADQNRELAALYDMAGFLNQARDDIHATCQGFLDRVMQQFNADGGSLRVLDPDGQKLHMIASAGLSEEIKDTEHCMRKDSCFCGEATRQGIVVIKDFSKLGHPANTFGCEKEGFASLAVFRIMNQDQVLGSFSLHFREKHEIPGPEAHLLDALGQQLGIALENRRLSAKARQLAIAEERNLVAQGLHDSIAQGLNYLNLQVQMLDSAIGSGKIDEARGIVRLLKIGVNESYQDVRELLANFREKLSVGELQGAVEDTLARFKRQTGIEAELDFDDSNGAPLSPEQQLQVLFILQEALSNVRKHAHATAVQVSIHNRRDFVLRVRDNGRGFDPAEVAARETQHVGLNIMRERADCLAAALALDSTPRLGTALTLTLPQQSRLAA